MRLDVNIFDQKSVSGNPNNLFDENFKIKK